MSSPSDSITTPGQDDRYRGIKGDRRVVFLSPADIRDIGVERGSLVDLVSRFQGVERVAESFSVVPYDIPQGAAATYFPETNVLVPVGSTADGSNTPTSKSIVITVRPR